MSRQGDIDSVLGNWFLEGPSAMPDRLFGAVLDRVERTPQRPLARLQLRFTDMTTTTRWLAAGSAAVLVLGIGLVALGRGQGPAPGSLPSPSPTESAGASPSAAAGAKLPASLQHPYIGPLKTIDGIETGDVSQIEFQGSVFIYHTGSLQLLHSVTTVDGNELVLRSAAATAEGCRVGDEGHYPFTTSPEGSILTIESGTDDCTQRHAAVPGTWQRSACTNNRENWCLGLVEPGTYASQYFVPAASGDNLRADFGALTYTVPDGWANSADWPGIYEIMRASSYEAGGVNEGVVTPDTISLLARASAAKLHAGCPEEAEPGVGTDASALAAWLRAHPGLVITEQADATIDGLKATVMDLALAPGWTETCDSQNPFVAAPLFVGDYHWALPKSDRMRVLLVDLPTGTTVVITVDPEDPGTFDQLVTDAMPIIESFDFK